MRRREGFDVPPPGLLVFDGREFTTAADWVAAYDAWYDARDQWESEHPGVVLPETQVLSSCPFDPGSIGIPHGGLWSRQKGEDGGDVTRCRQHGLTPDQH